MKKFIIKDTIINMENHVIQTYYCGKDGYVHDYPEYAEGWKRKHYAEKYIENEMTYSWNKKVDDRHCIESGKWLHHYEIIERDAD